MTIQRLQSHWGFTTMPFGRGLACTVPKPITRWLTWRFGDFT
jgi:hypothetical protein